MTEILPAILAKTPEELANKAQELPAEILCVHIDVLEDDVWTPIPQNYEAHLMVEEPHTIIERWIERGAKRIIVHPRSIEILGEILKFQEQVEMGLGIEMSDDLEKAGDMLTDMSFAHMMSIDEIGEQGHPFNPKVFDRIRTIQERFGVHRGISIDGGINTDNIEQVIDSGVDRIIVGSKFNEVWSLLTKEK